MNENQIEIYINGRRWLTDKSNRRVRIMVDLLKGHFKDQRPWKGRVVTEWESGVEFMPFIEWHKFTLVRA